MSDTLFGPFSVVATFYLFPCHAFHREQTYICNKILVSIKKNEEKKNLPNKGIRSMNISDVQRRVVCNCRQGGLAGADEEKIGQKKDCCCAGPTAFAGQKRAPRT